jgi:membrane-bound lytic murein transglycosylase B
MRFIVPVTIAALLNIVVNAVINVVVLAVVFVVLVAGGEARAQTEAGFQSWLKTFRSEALQKGIPPAVVAQSLAELSLNEKVIALDRDQPEFSRPIWHYLDALLVTEKRVIDGLSSKRRVQGILSSIEATYGVPDAILAAIWGIESNFGRIRGDFDVFQSIATLAYEGRRAQFWRSQLMDALRIVAEGHNGDRRLKGSWAGAMGHTQLIPESFRRYAVDFDQDGRKDIWSDDPTDALATTANYLRNFEWRSGEPVFLHVALPPTFDFAAADGRMTTLEWTAKGVLAADGSALPWGLAEAELYLPAGAQGPAFLTLANFRVIKRYNSSNAYALGVAVLAERLDQRPKRIFSWPTGDRPLSRTERFELQERLTAMGFDTNGIDGILGRQSRLAVQKFQQSRGLTADGYPSARILEALRSVSTTDSQPEQPEEEGVVTGVAASLAVIDPPEPQRRPDPTLLEPLDQSEIVEMQKLLNQLGFAVGDPDGKIGPKTMTGVALAVEALRLDLPPEPTAALLAALRRAIY